jgi:multidrug resistance protein MdtO
MTASGGSKSLVRSFIEMLRTELAWYPGRTALVARMVLACVTVVLLAEIFRIPGAILGSSFPILISRESPKASRMSAFQIGLACSIGTAEVIVGGMLTAGSPFLHVMWVLASLLAAFYAISSLNFSSASITASALVGVAVRVWDYPIRAEARVELTLYTLLSILIACVVTAIIETVCAKKNPPDAVLEGISRRLNLMEMLLSQTSAQESASPALTLQLSRSAAKGVDDLCELLATSGYDAAFHDLLATVIALTRQLIELGSNLVKTAQHLSIEDLERGRVIARNISSVRTGLARMEPPEWVDLAFANRASNPILMEIERTTGLIAQSFCNECFRLHCCLPAAAPSAPIGRRVPGTVQNAEHIKFAIRGTLSAFLCYVFYMSAGWMGLGPSIVTCILVARRLTGASRHRQVQRFAGFIVGAGVIGWGTEVFILPQLDSIAEYALLFASVVWLGSWVATSGPRLSFAGFQIVLAFSFVNLNRFTINTSLVPARDIVLGIVLGVVAMWLVNDHLWAQTSSASVRALLLGTLRSAANLNTVSTWSPEEVNQSLTAESSRINQDFDKLRDLADMYAFESFPKSQHESLVNRSIRTLLPELRAFLLVKTGLLQHRSLTQGELDQVLIREVDERASGVLLRLANAIERESTEQLPLWQVSAGELRARVSIEETKSRDENHLQEHSEIRLCGALLDVASDLERLARLNFTPENGAARVIGSWPVETIADA